MSQDRTEEPTAKRLKDAREKGQVARSRDLGTAAALLAATLAMEWFGARLIGGLSDRLAGDLARFGDNPLGVLTEGDLTQLLLGGGILLALLVTPIALAAALVGAGVQAFQGGFSFAPAAMELKWTRLNPAEGFKRFKLTESGADTLKTFIAVAAIVFVGWQPLRAAVVDGGRLAWLAPADVGRAAWQATDSLLWRVALALGLVGLADYGLQRYRLLSSLRMTKQEIKDEFRQTEGSPEIKARIRRLQRTMAQRRMLSDVPKATVVVTNPTHFAVALEYRRGAMAAPLVLAKGSDHMAARIRERARQHGIPIVENKPLAQALYKTADVGDAIPAALFSAVAEVLAQLIRLKQLVL
ncbi:MAG: flagellar biosynthesis protein FlhB [Vicinamibacterales bacterium]